MSNPKVAVIGLGASGAFAAKAAYDMKCEVEVYVTQAGKMSPGATWLHWLPEDVTSQFTPTQIYVMGKGTSDQYTKRQWGKVYPSSFPVTPAWEVGYDPTQVLEVLVPAACNINMIPYPLSDADIRDLSVGFDLVFQTFPTRVSKEEQPPLRSFVAAAKLGQSDPEKNFVVYNGTKIGIVVREAQLFGNHFLEFPKDMTAEEVWDQQDLDGYQVVTLKDLDPSTKPWQTVRSRIKLIGRWAQWDRKILSHDAYAIAQKHVQEFLDEQNS